jgi:hypothetical protein
MRRSRSSGECDLTGPGGREACGDSVFLEPPSSAASLVSREATLALSKAAAIACPFALASSMAAALGTVCGSPWWPAHWAPTNPATSAAQIGKTERSTRRGADSPLGLSSVTRTCLPNRSRLATVRRTVNLVDRFGRRDLHEEVVVLVRGAGNARKPEASEILNAGSPIGFHRPPPAGERST